MRNLKTDKLFIWLIIVTASIAVYSIIRLAMRHTGFFELQDVPVYKKVMFEIGTVLYAIMSVFLGGYYIHSFWKKEEVNHQNILAVCILMVSALLFSALLYGVSSYAMPVILVPLMLTFMSNKRTAQIMTIIITMMILPFTYTTPAVVFMSLFTGILSCILASKITQRREFPVLGIALVVCNLIILFAFCSTGEAGFEFEEFLKNGAITSIVTFACVIATIGLLPFFETISGVISPFELMDIANPTHKLLKRLITEAPGTYYHSIMVGNLAEAAAEKVGANPLLARVAAYYHDIGKITEPIYFMENQHGENIHDNMDPYESVKIITSHTTDGVRIAEKYKLPPQIIEIIGQHHGDTTVAWFYKKACDQLGAENVDIADFRYKSQTPSSKEAGIIMLADSVEAATKALSDKSVESIRERIDKIVNCKLAEGQLDNCDLTLKDISRIKEQFLQSINGYYHKRDEYPDKEAALPPGTEEQENL